MLCADVVLFKLVRKLLNFDLIVLDLSGVSFPGYGLVVFPCGAVVIESFLRLLVI
jgi:hypothetical protein